MRNTKKMLHCALFAALIAICSWIAVPFPPVSFTMQTFAVFLTLGLLGGKWGSISILIYLLLGAVGLPVFTGFRGGIASLIGPTGGFLLGFLVTAQIYRALERFHGFLAMIVGLLTCYTFGCLGYCLYAGQHGFLSALTVCVLPYLIPDICKLWLAYRMSQRLRKHLR